MKVHEKGADRDDQRFGRSDEGGGESIRRLRRRVDHRVLSGVAGGLADYLSVPPWLVRLGFVILAFTGTGILLYLVGWVLIPAQDEAESIADRALKGAVDGPAWLGGLLLLIGALLIASRTHLINPGLVWGIALIVAGVYVFRRSELPQERGRRQRATVDRRPGDRPGNDRFAARAGLPRRRGRGHDHDRGASPSASAAHAAVDASAAPTGRPALPASDPAWVGSCSGWRSPWPDCSRRSTRLARSR